LVQIDPSAWANPEKEGELKKQGTLLVLLWGWTKCSPSFPIGHVVKNWKQRWFVVKNDTMYYFKTKKVRYGSSFALEERLNQPHRTPSVSLSV